MNGSKNALQSVTLWGAIILIASQTIRFFGVEVSADEQAAIADNAVSIVTSAMNILGVVTVIVGRFRADKKITVLPGGSACLAWMMLLPVLLAGCSASAKTRYYQQIEAKAAAQQIALAQHAAGDLTDARLIELDTYEKAWRAALEAIKARLDAPAAPLEEMNIRAMLDTAEAVAAELIRFLEQHERDNDHARGTDSRGVDPGAGGDPVRPAADRPDRRADHARQAERPTHARTDRPDRASAANDQRAVGRGGRGGEGAAGTLRLHLLRLNPTSTAA